MKELIVKTTNATVNVNFEEVKASLVENLEKYKGIVVTDDNLKDCKDIQKGLSKLKKDIDSNRKEIKKQLEAPIKNFEGQCKELVCLISEVDAPIKEGIAIFDEMKREEKREYAREIIKDALVKYPLDDKYSNSLTVLDKYTLVATSKKAIKEDIFNRAEGLYKIQEDEKRVYQENLVIIKETIDQANLNLISKLNADIYIKKLEEGMNPTYIIREINDTASNLREAEERAAKIAEEKAKREQEQLEKKGDIKEEPKEEANSSKGTLENIKKDDTQLFQVKIEFELTLNEAIKLNKFLESNNIKFNTISKKKL
ncbi:DUF1351 domain-containing protein [Clostridium sp. Sa3CUN1]|uniref:DUF1351 domain-containing protein n=1 Tax=Clostridium gallinarum TaxID=2762246 RepID=A0ABR8Q273_9CLOT|nr:DUF1351 domain-containing protein [Clostridium gallinarum]MBD7914524.1 DUF1351 domain-containing protein [Clostridium gallinarum]